MNTLTSVNYYPVCFLMFKRKQALYIFFFAWISSKDGDPCRGWHKGSLFDTHVLLHQGVGEGSTPFPGLLHFTLNPYHIMLSVKQVSIKYHFFFVFSYDSTWDWTSVSRAISEHSNQYANVRFAWVTFIKHW